MDNAQNNGNVLTYDFTRGMLDQERTMTALLDRITTLQNLDIELSPEDIFHVKEVAARDVAQLPPSNQLMEGFQAGMLSVPIPEMHAEYMMHNVTSERARTDYLLGIKLADNRTGQQNYHDLSIYATEMAIV